MVIKLYARYPAVTRLQYTPEKALFDKVAYDRRFDGDDPEAYLLDDLRLDEESLRRLNKTRLKELAPFMTGRLKSIYNYLEELR